MISNDFYFTVINNGAIFGRLVRKDGSIYVFSLIARHIKEVAANFMLLHTLDCLNITVDAVAD